MGRYYANAIMEKDCMLICLFFKKSYDLYNKINITFYAVELKKKMIQKRKFYIILKFKKSRIEKKRKDSSMIIDMKN